MWKLLLLGASLLSAQEASLECSNHAATETSAVRGPAGVTAVLKVSSADDHSKNSHDCMADYQLLVSSGAGIAPTVVDFLSSDGDWGRRLSVHLDGFSRDGKRVFGILSEAGRFPIATLFDHDTATGAVKLVDLKKDLAQLKAANCGLTFAVAGTTEIGSIVLEPGGANECRNNYRWLLDPKDGRLRRLPQGKPTVRLYEPAP